MGGDETYLLKEVCSLLLFVPAASCGHLVLLSSPYPPVVILLHLKQGGGGGG